jgi:putative membrane protein
VHILLEWLVLSFAFWLTSRIVPGFRVAGMWDAIVVAAIFGVVNFFLGAFLYYAIGIATLGIGLLLSLLTHWFVNAVLLKITDALTRRLDVQSFGSALVAALVISVLGKIGIYVVGVAMHHSPPGSVYL